MVEDINAYIIEARNKKATDAQIKTTLMNAGWPENQVNQALATPGTSAILPPPPVPHTGMWTGFLYILFFISLYTLASSMAGIFHAGVEKIYPNNNPDEYLLFNFYDDQMIRRYLASLIVSFPLFLILGIQLKKQLIHTPVTQNLRSRKILIYITLIVTFLILLWQISTILYTFLSGNLTNNTFGHFGVTTLVAGGTFLYFINEVKNDRKIF